MIVILIYVIYIYHTVGEMIKRRDGCEQPITVMHFFLTAVISISFVVYMSSHDYTVSSTE